MFEFDGFERSPTTSFACRFRNGPFDAYENQQRIPCPNCASTTSRSRSTGTAPAPARDWSTHSAWVVWEESTLSYAGVCTDETRAKADHDEGGPVFHFVTGE